MAYRAAICDDCAADAQFVSEILKAWADERGAEVNAEIYPSAESFLFAYDENKAYDMLLLDIEMSGMDGVSMARRVRACGEQNRADNIHNGIQRLYRRRLRCCGAALPYEAREQGKAVRRA